MDIKITGRPNLTKWLHAFLALFITFELLSELDMKAIWKRKGELHFRHLLFHAHIWVGMCTALIVLLYWIHLYYNKNVFYHLFPYRGIYLENICVDITGLMRFCLPEPGLRGGLPGLIQGLGLVAVTGMALTGFIMFFLIPNFGVSTPIHIYEIPKKIHDYISEFVWVYFWIHVGAVLLHFFNAVARRFAVQ